MDADIIIPIAAMLIGGLILLVPIAAIALRFAVKPAMEAYLRLRTQAGPGEEVRVLEQRVALLEQQMREVVERARPAALPPIAVATPPAAHAADAPPAPPV